MAVDVQFSMITDVLNYSKMKFFIKIGIFITCCLLLCSCPGGEFTDYKLSGETADTMGYYKILSESSDDYLVKVGIAKSFINDKKTFLFAEFKNAENAEFDITSKQYGKLIQDSINPKIFKKEIKTMRKSIDTIIISDNKYRYYFIH